MISRGFVSPAQVGRECQRHSLQRAVAGLDGRQDSRSLLALEPWQEAGSHHRRLATPRRARYEERERSRTGKALKTGTDFGIASEKDGRVIPIEATESGIRRAVFVPAELVAGPEADGGQICDQRVDKAFDVRFRLHRLAIGKYAVYRDLVLRDLDDVLAACDADSELGVTPG